MMRTRVEERGARAPEALAAAVERAARRPPPAPPAPKTPVRAPSLFGVDPIAPSVTEALNSLRMQLQAGVPLGKSLRTCGGMCKPEAAKRAFIRAADEVEAGASFDEILHTLSVALSFPEQAILSAGWQAGKIEPAIRSVVSRRDVMYKTRSEVRSKLILPGILLVVASFIAPAPAYVIGMMQGGGITGGEYLARALTPIAIALGLFFALRMFQRASARQHAGRGLDGPPPPAMPWDYPMLKVPVLAMVQKWHNRGDFASLMADLLGAGLGTINALKVCAKTLSNGVYRNDVIKCQRRVEKEGIPIAEALPRTDLWPADWLAALEVAHTSGEEEAVFRRLGEQGREQYLRAVRAAGTAAGWGAYALVSGYILFQILSMATQAAGQLNDAMEGLF